MLERQQQGSVGDVKVGRLTRRAGCLSFESEGPGGGLVGGTLEDKVEV